VLAKQVPARPVLPSQPIQIHVVDERYAVATCGNMVVIAWRGETRVAAVARAKSILLDAFSRGHGKYGLMQFVERTAPPPDGEARDALGGMLAAGRGYITGSSLVYPGTGFWAAAARAFVTGLQLLARPGFPHVTFPTVGEAADWHRQLLVNEEATPTRADICESVARIQAAFEQLDLRGSS
jgi:hypothetical protein